MKSHCKPTDAGIKNSICFIIPAYSAARSASLHCQPCFCGAHRQVLADRLPYLAGHNALLSNRTTDT
jgi:hypothetical protein